MPHLLHMLRPGPQWLRSHRRWAGGHLPSHIFRKLTPSGIILTSKRPCHNVLLPLCPAAGEKRGSAGRKLGVDLRACLGKASWLLPWPLLWVASPCEMCAAHSMCTGHLCAWGHWLFAVAQGRRGRQKGGCLGEGVISGLEVGRVVSGNRQPCEWMT